jgi:LysM repeat protein
MMQNLYLDTIQKNKKTHIVKQGDVLGQIAIDNNVSVDEIMSWNNLKNTMIYQDQKLILMSEHNRLHNDYNFKKVSQEKYFWEIVESNPKVTIKAICKYNYYHELTPNQQLKITKK